MPRTAAKVKHDHSLNLFVSGEVKLALERLAQIRQTTVADVVRTLFRFAIPIISSLYSVEQELIDELQEIGSRRRKSSAVPVTVENRTRS